MGLYKHGSEGEVCRQEKACCREEGSSTQKGSEACQQECQEGCCQEGSVCTDKDCEGNPWNPNQEDPHLRQMEEVEDAEDAQEAQVPPALCSSEKQDGRPRCHQAPDDHRSLHEEDRGQQPSGLPHPPALHQASDPLCREAAVRHRGG